MKKLILLFIAVASMSVAKPARAQFFLDCSCLATQSVLITNACQAVVPDLCQFTNCFQSTVVPPPQIFCNQSPPAGTPVGPGFYGITVNVFVPGAAPQSCTLLFQVNPPSTGCAFALICATNKTVECGSTWSFDPPTWVNQCPDPLGGPGNVLLNVVNTITNGTCPQIITQTWLGIDDCGLSATCSQTVTVVDTTPPVLTCSCLTNSAVFPPVPLTVVACLTNVPDLCVYASFCATDNCGPPTCKQTPPGGTIVGPGIYPLTVTVTDCAGNAASCQVVFTVLSPANGPFALVCASNKTVQCGSQWNFNPPTPTNACCAAAGLPNGGVTLISVTTVTSGFCPQVITRTWKATDACDKTNQCSQTVTVVDTTPPVLDCVCLTNSAAVPPLPLTVIACTTNIPALCQRALACATDNCGPLTCSQSPMAGMAVGPGVHPITVTVTDCAGNTSSCLVNFTVLAPTAGCTTNHCLTPPSGMVAWWPLDELTGATLFVDATGNGHTAIVESGGPVGSPFSPTSWPVGKVAGANYFYGLSPRGRALNTPMLNFNTNSFSVDCWVNPVLTGTLFWHPIVDKLNQTSPATGFGYAVGLLNQKLVLKVGSGTLYTYTSVGSVSYGSWGFVAVAVDRTAGTVTFHVNGVSEPPQPLFPTGSFNSTVDLLIGSTYNANIGLGELAVDELELFSRPLATNEMSALWLADSLGKCKTNTCIASIFCPSDMTVTRSCTQTCATVTYAAPLFTNGVLAGCTPPSGTCFPLGNTTVNCTATNTCGQPATCRFIITVNAATNCQPCDFILAQRLYSGATTCVLPTGAQEPLWVNTAAPGGPIPMVVVDTNLWPIAGGPWLPPSADSAWVGPSASSIGPAGWYTNRWTFNGACTNVCLRGRFATDDDGYLYINGTLVAGPSGFTAWTPIYVCKGFTAGPNTIELVVHNAGGPTGFRTELEIWTQCCTPCASQTNAWNTGMGGPTGNVPLSASTADSHYLLISQPPGGCTGPAQVLLPGSLPGVWVPNGPNSQWIGAGPTANCQGGVYHYRLCFYLPCADGASIIGQWTADDWASMRLNGVPTGNTVPSIQFPNLSFAGWHPVRITNGFVCGNNTLDLYVTNAWTVSNPTGLRAQLTNIFNNCCTNCTPQPCSCSLTNGDFTQPVPANGTGGGWTSSGLFAGAGWQASGGNPGGTFLLNNIGDPATDPTISQRICCLTPGQCYTLRGQRKVQAWYGQTAPSFAVLVDGAAILTLPVPTNPADTNWHDFSVSFTATNACQTIGFAAEINGTDVSYWIDNLRLECCNPNCHVVLTCPPNQVLLTCNNSAVINYKTTASGNTGPVVCTPPTGSQLPLGTNLVVCTATNSCGDAATCYFTVIVKPPPNRWLCRQLGIGIPFDLVGGATAALRPGVGIGDPAICLFPNPTSTTSGLLLQPGTAQAIRFTTLLDFTAPVGSGFDLALPPDPMHPNDPPILSIHRKSGPKGYCVKMAKRFADEPGASMRVFVVNTNGNLLDSLEFTPAEVQADGVFDINFQPGVDNCHITVEVDCKTGAVSVEIPGPIAVSARRKGWDGCIYGPDRPVKKPTARVTMIPPRAPGLPPITDLYLRASGWSEMVVEDPAITAAGRKWGDGHVTLIKAYDDGDSLEFVAVGEGGGAHVDLGHAASFDLRLTKFATNPPPFGEQLLTRTIGPIRGLTNRPPPPVLDTMLMQATAAGVECSVDFTPLDSPTVTVSIYKNGGLVAQRAGLPGLLGQALVVLPEWPQTLGKIGGRTPCRRITIKTGTIRLLGSGPFDPVADYIGDEIRITAELAEAAPRPDYYSGFEFEATEGADWGISQLSRTLACPPTSLSISPSPDGVSITWPGDGLRLQGAERVLGPWLDLGVGSPVAIPAGSAARFFRLICD